MSNYTLYLYTDNPELYQLYQQTSVKNKGDAGIDLYTPSTETYTQHSSPIFLNHQIVCRMTKGDETGETPVSYYLYPRSSISKTPLRLANSVGIIDSGYRGHIIAALDYIRGYEYTVDKHSRLVQLCSPTLEPVRLVVCDSLEEMDMKTDRGSGGFGSTGI
jgi:dUTP pyrophosphatase